MKLASPNNSEFTDYDKQINMKHESPGWLPVVEVFRTLGMNPGSLPVLHK
jgi:hypothetical protein